MALYGLQREAEKRVRVAEHISKTLVKNFSVDKDIADLVALDTINQILGAKPDEKPVKHQFIKSLATKSSALVVTYWKSFLKWTGGITVVSTAAYLLLLFIIWFMNYNPYPYLYSPIPENVRFADEPTHVFTDTPKGLSPANHLCLYSGGTSEKGDSVNCIHRNKLEKLNAALDKAVSEDINGVVWSEANGNGEMWDIERNNYRFIITATKDENFK